MDALLSVLSGPWTIAILWMLRQNGPTRFGELRRMVQGISARVLTERLRRLEAAGLVDREYRPSVPPQVTYGLSARGKELQVAFDALSATARRWAEEDAATGSGPARVQAPPAPLPTGQESE